MKEIVEGGVVTGHKFNHHWQIYEILNELKGLNDAWEGFFIMSLKPFFGCFKAKCIRFMSVVIKS